MSQRAYVEIGFLRQVGDAAPILEAMAVMMESISSITIMARNTISAVYRVAQIVAGVPNLLQQNKAWFLKIQKYDLSLIFD